MAASSMPGTPTASKITIGLFAPSRRQASMAGSTDGSTTSCAPMVTASRRRVSEKSAATIGSTPMACSAAITARPTGPAPSTTAAWPGVICDRLTACSPTAIGSVSAARRASRPLGTFSESRSLSTISSP